jgi:hypothetical protein
VCSSTGAAARGTSVFTWTLASGFSVCTSARNWKAACFQLLQTQMDCTIGHDAKARCAYHERVPACLNLELKEVTVNFTH